jgi:hypothetical protein
LSITSRMYMGTLAYKSCGLFVGMAFGFLGFALFLFGIRDLMAVKGTYGKASLDIAKMSPGAFVILCASIIIAICVARGAAIDYQNDGTNLPPSNASQREQELQNLKDIEQTFPNLGQPDRPDNQGTTERRVPKLPQRKK